MRPVILFVGVLGLVLAVPAGAAPEPFAFEDAEGDVQRDGEDYDGQYADTVDIVEARLEEDGEALVFRLELADLGEYELPPLEQDFATQYALTFERAQDEAAFSLRADYAALVYSADPLGRWHFQVHDQQADEWRDADGRVDGDTLEWTVTPDEVGVSPETVMSRWHASTWWSDVEDSPQIGDDASTDVAYRLGVGSVETPAAEPVPPASEVCRSTGARLALHDAADDVRSASSEYRGAGREALDLRYACVAQDGDDLVLELVLVDLAGIEQELAAEDYTTQYALRFQAGEGHPGYAVRAKHAGHVCGGEPGSGWGFRLHDGGSGRWPAATGEAHEDRFVWRLPRTEVSGTAAEGLFNWTAQSWTYPTGGHGAQFGDEARGEASYAARNHAMIGADGEPGFCEARGEAELQSDVRQLAPSLPAAAFLLVLVVAVMRRR